VNEDGISCGDVMVLNLASDWSPGGGWLKGSLAQEEELFYRTSLGIDLGFSKDAKPHPYDPSRKWHYPLQSDQVIYTPKAVVLRQDASNGYACNKPKDRCVVSFLAVSAIRNPKCIQNKNKEWTFANKFDEELTRRKICAIFELAIVKKHTVLVLGALGCGCFHGPPHAVARLFKEAIQIYETYFKLVTFAILDHHPSSPDSNFTIFYDALTSK
jgi:uncharacterized protein (TIGR02452 family)